VAGRWEYDERTLCHSPQERLFFHGEWQDGLLPVHGVGVDTLAQYRKFSQRIDALQHAAHFAIPTLKVAVTPELLALDAIAFSRWLDSEGFSDAQLRWYLDYCCRDDYGAGIAQVSAWAGIHYFASRHGFHAPGDPSGSANDANPERDGVLTWPEGNGWLTKQLAAPLGERLRTGQVVTRIAELRGGVEVDAWDAAIEIAGALAGRALHRRAAGVHRRARGRKRARGAEARRRARALRAVAGGQRAPARPAGRPPSAPRPAGTT
jgi:hypothetical protein